MNAHDPHNPLLEQLNELADLRPHDQATARALERVRAALGNASVPFSTPQRRRIMTLRNVAAIAASLLILAVAVHWLRPFQPAQSLAFEDVQKAVEQTKSVQYVQTRVDRDKQGRKGPEETDKVMVLGRYRIRTESRMTAPGDPLPEGQSWSTMDEPSIVIQNAETGAILSLLPESKRYVIPQVFMSIDPDTGEFNEEKPRPTPEADFYTRLREVPANAAKLPTKQIGDVAAEGFQVVETIERPRSGHTETWTRTFWVNPATKLPIRIETSSRSTNPMMADSDWVTKDIIFDAPLDEALFSTEPPAGYTAAAKAAGK
jgi:hypothetical protein